MASSNSARSAFWKVLIGVLLVIAIIAVVAEFGLRWFVGDRMKSEFVKSAESEGVQVTEDPSVSFGTAPLLWGLAQGSISQMDMSVPSTLDINGTEIKGQPATEVHVEDLDISSETAGTLKATTTVPDEYLLANFQNNIVEQSGSEQAGNLVVSDIVARDEVLNVEFAAGLASLTLVPAAKDGAMEITAEKASVLGFDLPQQATDQISRALKDGMKEQVIGDLRVEDVRVLDGQMELDVSGENVPLREMGSQLSGPPEA